MRILSDSMERRPNIDEIQKKADAFLLGLLRQNSGKSAEETARNIPDLAFRDGNPVRDFFVAAVFPSMYLSAP